MWQVMTIAHTLAEQTSCPAKHQYGCHLLQRCIATCSEVRHDPRSSVGTGEFVRMIDDISLKLVQKFEELAFNRRGNFVLQYVCSMAQKISVPLLVLTFVPMSLGTVCTNLQAI